MKESDYYKLQARLAQKAKKSHLPFRALFEITYRCNLACRHCYIRHTTNQKELSTKEVYLVLRQLAAAGTLNLGFTGGEPLLRRDIFAILGYAKSRGFNIIIYTNGTLITPSVAGKLQKIGVNKIDVSSHTLKEDVFDWFTRVPGTQQKVLRAFKLLRNRGIETCLKVVPMSINKDEIIKLRYLAVQELGVHFRYGSTVTPAWGGAKDNLQFRISPSQSQKIEQQIQGDVAREQCKANLPHGGKILKEKHRWVRKINHNQLFRCNAGQTDVIINPFGQMRLCIDIPEPEFPILPNNFFSSWARLVDYAKNTAPGPAYQCRDCALVQYCDFCPAMGYLENKDASACVPYYRRLASLLKKQVEKENNA